MAQDQLRKAFALMKQGDSKQAALIVQSVIKQDRNSVPAWWMMANVLDDPAKKQKALEKVLSLDAKHVGAKKMLASLNGQATSAKQSPTRASKPASSDNTSGIEVEFDWGKLDARDSKNKVEKEGSEDKVIKLATYVMGALLIVVLVMAIVFVMIPGFLNSQISNQVEDSMTHFLTAMIAGDFETAEQYVCAQYHRDQGRSYYFALGLNPIYADSQANLSNINIKVSDFETDGATATLSGNVRMIPTEGEPYNLSVDDIMGAEGFAYETTSFVFIRENEHWLLCDETFANES